MAVVKNLLLAVDGSKNSLRAAKYVAMRAKADKHLHVLVLNVQSPLPSSRTNTQAMIKQYHDSQSEEALGPVRALFEGLEFSAEAYVRIGETARTITDVARETRCGEIVMGTRGFGSIKGLVLGSVTTKVIHLARTPVIVIP